MIEDAVRSHIARMRARAEGDGALGVADGVEWMQTRDDATLHIPFPDPTADLGPLVDLADANGARRVAVWSAVDEPRAALADLGFEVGWQPWWMSAAPEDIPAPEDLSEPDASGRVRLTPRLRAEESGREGLARRDDVLRAEATVDGRYAGHAWLHLDGDLAGLYDMEVKRRFRRRGLGRRLLSTLAAEGARRGARRIALNATPEGERLYSACGFVRDGNGRTWWRHR